MDDYPKGISFFHEHFKANWILIVVVSKMFNSPASTF